MHPGRPIVLVSLTFGTLLRVILGAAVPACVALYFAGLSPVHAGAFSALCGLFTVILLGFLPGWHGWGLVAINPADSEHGGGTFLGLASYEIAGDDADDDDIEEWFEEEEPEVKHTPPRPSRPPFGFTA